MIINLLNPVVIQQEYLTLRDEEIVVEYLRTQNVSFFNLLYDRYNNKVYAKAISMLKNEPLAEDVTQDIFVKVLLSISKFEGKSKFSTWLFSLTYNYCIDIIRKAKKQKIVNVEDYNNYDNLDESQWDNEIKETHVFRLREVLSKLDGEDTSILLMKYQDDLSIKEISEMTNKSESAVKMKILRAKERFMKVYNNTYAKIG